MSVRVFPPDGDANQGDVAAAIDLMSQDHSADLINLSLTADSPSQIEHDAIVDAFERGTVCVCAAGNTAGAIAYPAAFPEAVSVSALGLRGWGPPGSVAAAMIPTDSGQFGVDGMFLAPFSNRGPSLDCCAPGVGLVSTFPARGAMSAPFGDDSGTSCSSPIALAVLADLLSGSPGLLKSSRDRARAEGFVKLLFGACADVRLDPQSQGHGLPRIAPAGGGKYV
jgi:subtilisin